MSGVVCSADVVRWRALATRAVMLALLAPSALALAGPRVQFDVADRVVARDVSTEDFLQANPGERLVEVRFEISAYFLRGESDDLVRTLHFIELFSPHVTIVDLEPKTTLSSDIVGVVGEERKRERTRSLGISFGTHLEALGKLSGAADMGTKTTNSTRFEQRPTLELVAASGTLRRGRGAYFKLHPSSQETFEGTREFALVLRVPQRWQGGVMQLTCEAYGASGSLVPPLEEQAIAGRGRFVLALYGEGDEQAREAAIRLGEAETCFRAAVTRRRDDVQRAASPHWAHRLGTTLKLVESRLPEDWVEQVLYCHPRRELPAFLERLPGEVSSAARKYHLAKRELALLQAGPTGLR